MNELVLDTGVGGLICRQCEDLFKNRIAYVRGVIRRRPSFGSIAEAGNGEIRFPGHGEKRQRAAL